MAFVTYVLLEALLAGLKGHFGPELFSRNATGSFFLVVVEILGLKLGCYLMNIHNDSQWLDLMAYAGYKFVGIILTIVTAEVFNGGKGTGGWVGWMTFGYTFSALAFFLVGLAKPCRLCCCRRASADLVHRSDQ